MPRWSAAAPPGSTTATTATPPCRCWRPRPAPPAAAFGPCRRRSGCRPGSGAAGGGWSGRGGPPRQRRAARRRADPPPRSDSVRLTGDPLHHRPDRAHLDAVLEEVALVIGIAPPVPAAF